MSEKIKFTAFSIDFATDGIEQEFEVYGIVPDPETVGESIEYVNGFLQKTIRVRMGYQIKFYPHSTNATTGNNTQSVMAKFLAISQKKHIYIAPGDGDALFPRWQDSTNFPFTNLDVGDYGREVIVEATAVTDAWDFGEETLEVTLKEKALR